MSRMTAIEVDQRTAMKGMTMQVRITGKVRMRICIWVALRLMRFASFVLGPKATVIVDLEN